MSVHHAGLHDKKHKAFGRIFILFIINSLYAISAI
jgi:hypothetical protein